MLARAAPPSVPHVLRTCAKDNMHAYLHVGVHDGMQADHLRALLAPLNASEPHYIGRVMHDAGLATRAFVAGGPGEVLSSAAVRLMGEALLLEWTPLEQRPQQRPSRALAQEGGRAAEPAREGERTIDEGDQAIDADQSSARGGTVGDGAPGAQEEVAVNTPRGEDAAAEMPSPPPPVFSQKRTYAEDLELGLSFRRLRPPIHPRDAVDNNTGAALFLAAGTGVEQHMCVCVCCVCVCACARVRACVCVSMPFA
jgi:hypothetical protein